MAARAKSFVPKTPESKKAWKEFFDIKSSTIDVGYGYAITSHKVQGSTYNSAYVLEGDIMSFPGGIEQTNRMMYTAVSRPRKKLVIFIDCLEFKICSNCELSKEEGINCKFGVTETITS